MELIQWDVYEVKSEKYPLTGNKVRGRLRKFSLEKEINLLVENTQDGPPRIRFAVIAGDNIAPIRKFLLKLFPDIKITEVFDKVANPVLSRVQVNLKERYEI